MSSLRRFVFFYFFICFYRTAIVLSYTCINYFYGIAEQLYEQFTQVLFFVVKLLYIMNNFTDGRIDFWFVAAQLYEQSTQVGSIFGILLMNYTNSGGSLNLFLLHFGILHYILYFMGLDYLLLITL